MRSDVQREYETGQLIRMPLCPQCDSSAAGAASGVSTFATPVVSAGVGANSPGSFPANAAFMKSIQTGSAARAPLSFAPKDFFSSWPIQTPLLVAGENPLNQASVKS